MPLSMNEWRSSAISGTVGIFHFELLAETGETALDVALHGRRLDSGHLGDLLGRPAVAMNQDDGDALALGECSQGRTERRLESMRSIVLRDEGGARFALSDAARADPVQVATGIAHFCDLGPVLPGEGQCLSGRLSTSFPAELRHQGAMQLWLCSFDELTKRILARSLHPLPLFPLPT